MVLLRLCWGLFLGGFMSCLLYCSWAVEHGKKRFGMRDNTELFTGLSLWPIAIAVFFGLYLISSGLYSRERILNGCVEFGSLFVQIMMFINVYDVCLLCILPVCRKYLYARTCAVMWLLPVFLFWNPFILMETSVSPLVVLYISKEVWFILLRIWFTGFSVFFFGQIVLHLIWKKKLMEHSVPVKDEEMCVWLEEEKEKLGLTLSTVELRVSRGLDTPLSLGMFKRKKYTFLPDQSFSEEELRLIFRHELHHIQRRDMDTKFFFAFCRSLGWFHPLVWIAVRKAGQDLELSCDEIVLEGASAKEKERYARLLLSTAGHSGGFSTCLSASANTLRYRLRSVMSSAKRKMGIPVLMLLMLFGTFFVGSVGFSYERGTLDELVFHSVAEEQDIAVSCIYGEMKTECESGSEEIIAYLNTLEAEHLLSDQDLMEKSDVDFSLNLETEDGQTFMRLDGRQFTVMTLLDSGKEENEKYRIRSDVDWAYLESLLE